MTRIDSASKWNDTGFDLETGRSYRYQATGIWKDWYIKSDANGFSCFLMELFSATKRVPSARWLQLIGSINRDQTRFFPLGTQGTFTAPASGRLWAFANDARFAYGNNGGSVELKIEEI